MTSFSKLAPVASTCIEYVHPWQQSCTIATAGLILQSSLDSFRIYSAVYTVRYTSLTSMVRFLKKSIIISQPFSFLAKSLDERSGAHAQRS